VLIVTLLIIAAAVYLMVRRVDVRLVLLGAGLAMALLARDPLVIPDTFARAMVAGMVAPICAAMGFAMVMTATGCDRHLVHALLTPIRRVRPLVLPGGVLVAYFINMAISSQASTAAALGPILVPLLVASGYSPAVAGAALLLGASFGGDLLNPGSQDVQAIAGVANLPAAALSRRIIPASIAGALVATIVFTILNRRSTAVAVDDATGHELPAAAATQAAIIPPPSLEDFRIDPLRAAIPLVPIALLLLAYGGVPWLRWLITIPAAPDWKPLANGLPIVRAMLIGCAVAAVVCWRDVARVGRSFFDGMGAAYGTIISLTITAQCFGAGIAAVGVSQTLLDLAARTGSLKLLSAGFPWALATLSGSGSGPIVAFGETFLRRLPPDDHTTLLAALACLGGAAGRTMSPVAAVTVYTAGLVGVSPIVLIRKLLPALLAGAVVAMLVAKR
jgi:DcuC family C4-dicarboxylate transporter